jgi:hypothetical protein
MGESGNACRVLVGKLEGKRPFVELDIDSWIVRVLELVLKQ